MQIRFYFFEHREEFEEIGKFGDPGYHRVPKPNATKEGIQSLYRFQVESEDELVVIDKQEISRRMIEKFRNSECYKHKSEQERQEIIDYLSKTTDLR